MEFSLNSLNANCMQHLVICHYAILHMCCILDVTMQASHPNRIGITRTPGCPSSMQPGQNIQPRPAVNSWGARSRGGRSGRSVKRGGSTAVGQKNLAANVRRTIYICDIDSQVTAGIFECDCLFSAISHEHGCHF